MTQVCGLGHTQAACTQSRCGGTCTSLQLGSESLQLMCRHGPSSPCHAGCAANTEADQTNSPLAPKHMDERLCLVCGGRSTDDPASKQHIPGTNTRGPRTSTSRHRFQTQALDGSHRCVMFQCSLSGPPGPLARFARPECSLLTSAAIPTVAWAERGTR